MGASAESSIEEPDMKAHETYMKYMDLYLKLYEDLKDTFKTAY